jgi:hypothetical protein
VPASLDGRPVGKKPDRPLSKRPIVATKIETPQSKKIRDATRMCRLAIEDCEALLKRTEEVLRRSGQDNDRRYSDD